MSARASRLLTTEATGELAEKCPYFDTVEADGKPKEAQAITKLIARMRAAKYDMIYDLEGSSRTNNYFQGMRPWPPKLVGPGRRAARTPISIPSATICTRSIVSPANLKAAGIEVDGRLLPDLSLAAPGVARSAAPAAGFFRHSRALRVAAAARLGCRAERGAGRRPNTSSWRGAHRPPRRDSRWCSAAPRSARSARPLPRPSRAPRTSSPAPTCSNASAWPNARLFALGDDVELMHVAAAAGAPCLVFLSSGPIPSGPCPAGPRRGGGLHRRGDRRPAGRAGGRGNCAIAASISEAATA